MSHAGSPKTSRWSGVAAPRARGYQMNCRSSSEWPGVSAKAQSPAATARAASASSFCAIVSNSGETVRGSVRLTCVRASPGASSLSCVKPTWYASSPSACPCVVPSSELAASSHVAAASGATSVERQRRRVRPSDPCAAAGLSGNPAASGLHVHSAEHEPHSRRTSPFSSPHGCAQCVSHSIGGEACGGASPTLSVAASAIAASCLERNAERTKATSSAERAPRMH
eukprot:2293185-Prymnesium_polylepis.1